MGINDRIRHLRKSVLEMNQRQFAMSLGMSQAGISGMERVGATVPESTIKLICKTHGVSESWLRDGEGEISDTDAPNKIVDSAFSLDSYASTHGCTELERDIMKAYFDLDPDVRGKVLAHFEERLARRQQKTPAPATPEERARARADELTDSGFQYLRDNGDHTVYTKPGYRRIEVPKHREINEYTAKAILKQAGLI